MPEYISKYTGNEIDEGIRKSLESYNNSEIDKMITDLISDLDSKIKTIDNKLGKKAESSSLNSHINDRNSHISTEDRSSWNASAVTLGCKCLNFIENKHRDNITKNGITAAFQSDGGIKLSGTNTTEAFALIWNIAYPAATGAGSENDHKKHIPNGNYILKSTGNAGALIQIFGNRDDGSLELIEFTSDSDKEVTIDDTYAYNHVRIRISKGASFDETVIYPMLVPKGVEVSEFVPYRPTVQEQIDGLVTMERFLTHNDNSARHTNNSERAKWDGYEARINALTARIEALEGAKD